MSKFNCGSFKDGLNLRLRVKITKYIARYLTQIGNRQTLITLQKWSQVTFFSIWDNSIVQKMKTLVKNAS